MVKVNQSHILINEEVVVAEKYTYPSITFCYKYKHGGKDVLKNYYPSLFDKWKKLGKLIRPLQVPIPLKCCQFYFYFAESRFCIPPQVVVCPVLTDMVVTLIPLPMLLITRSVVNTVLKNTIAPFGHITEEAVLSKVKTLLKQSIPMPQRVSKIASLIKQKVGIKGSNNQWFLN